MVHILTALPYKIPIIATITLHILPTMDVNCYKRLKKEAQNLHKESDDSINLEVNPNDVKSWRAKITGPDGSAYAGYSFNLSISVGDNYPLAPPTMTFLTRIFHPNVHFDTGEICLDILKKVIVVFSIQ